MNSEIDIYMNKIHIEIQEFIRNLDIVYKNYNCTIKLDYSSTRSYHRGGIYKDKTIIVNYAMKSFIVPKSIYYFTEYARFAKDKEIGSISSSNYSAICLAISCHEQAHAARAFVNQSNIDGHNDKWKKLYAILRNHFVNNREDISFTGNKPNTNKKKICLPSEQIDFNELAHKKGLKQDIKLGTVFRLKNGKTLFKIAGWYKAAKKYPVLAKNIEKDIIYKLTLADVNNSTIETIITKKKLYD